MSFLAFPPPLGRGLDFANTRAWRGSARPTETLQGPADLLAWCAKTGDLAPDLVQACGDVWVGGGRGEFMAALRLREALWALFFAQARGEPAAEGEFGVLQRALAGAAPRTDLVPADGRLAWRVEAGTPTLEILLSPVLWSAADLLAGPSRARLKCCANEKCRWLFLDDSKSGNRRWCSMSACGNRAKAARHYRHSHRAPEDPAAAG